MASTYVNNLRLNEMATGDASGTWGTTTNTNLELVGQALGYGTEGITTNANTHTSTVADGAADEARAMYIKYTGTLDSACTITIGPNTLKRVHIIENATSGSQNIIIKQGSGATVTIGNGNVSVVTLDGAGSGAAVLNAFTDLETAGTITVAGNLIASADATVGDDLSLVSDAAVLGFGADTDVTLTHVADTGLLLNSSRQLQFGDSGTYIHQSADGTLDLVADTEIEINATTIDMNGALNLSGNALVSGEVQTANIGYTDGDNAITIADGGGITAANGITSTAASNTFGATSFNDADITNVGSIALDTITNDGTDITLDVAGDINLDADGGDINLKDGGTAMGRLGLENGDLNIASSQQDYDIKLKGNDGGSVITALTLDMSEAGAASFNGAVKIPGFISHVGDDNSFFGFPGGDEYRLELGGVERISMNGTESVFNEDGEDRDFRVESNNHASALFVNGADGKVTMQGATTIIGSAASSTNVELNINGVASKATRIQFQEGGANKWLLGQGAASETSAFELFNAVGTIALSVSRSTNVATFAAGIAVTAGDLVIPGAIIHAGDTDTKLDFNQADTMRLIAGDTTAWICNGSSMVVNEDSADFDFRVESNGNANMLFVDGGNDAVVIGGTGHGSNGKTLTIGSSDATAQIAAGGANTHLTLNSVGTSGSIIFTTGGTNSQPGTNTERARIANNGDLLFGTTSVADLSKACFSFDLSSGRLVLTADGATTEPMILNRQDSDGVMVEFRQANSVEGTISVSGSTVSYNGFSGSHDSSGIPSDTELGTVCSTIDELDTYPDTRKDLEGNDEDHPRKGQTRPDHAKIKVSDAVGDTRVYGVLGGFQKDGKPVVNSVGIGSIKVTGACNGGDLLESNGDGTAKVQSDDIIRSKTIGKVTIGNSTASVKLVSCVLYCG